MDQKIARKLEAAGIDKAAALAALATRSVRIETARCALAKLALGASRFGGSPDVPAGFAWPMRDGNPLTFLAQLDLGELRAADLPSSGWLLFFYDVDEQPWGFRPGDGPGARVVHVRAKRDELKRVRHPKTHGGQTFKPCRLAFTRVLDLPDHGDSLVEAIAPKHDDAQWEAYAQVTEKLCGVEAGAQYHHLLGHPQLVQNDMRGECALVTAGIDCGDGSGYEGRRAKQLLRDAPNQWRLLLQIDTDEEGPGWMWGDCGRLYFWMRRDHLAAQEFERAWLVLQCG